MVERGTVNTMIDVRFILEAFYGLFYNYISKVLQGIIGYVLKYGWR